jgi:hypothetical protein
MNARWRLAAAAVFSCLAFSYHIPAALQNVRFLRGNDNTAVLTFALEPLCPVIEDFTRFERPDDLFVTDRIISINGQTIDSGSTLGRVLAELRPGSGLELEVEHYPPGAQSWRQFVFVTASERTSGTIRDYALYFGILFPLMCVGLAMAGLAAKPLENRTWIVCGVLLFCAQLALFSRAEPDQWPLWLQLPATLFHDGASWTGPIWIFLLLLDVRQGRVPRLQWFHRVPIGTVGAVALIMCAGSLMASISYAALEPLAPAIPFVAWLALSSIYVAVSALFFGLILGKGPRIGLAYFRYQRLRVAAWLSFAPMIAAFGPRTFGLGRGFDTLNSLDLWILVWGSLSFLPLTIGITHLSPPAEPLETSLRHKLAQAAPWLAGLMDQTAFREQARAEEEIRALCDAIPEHPESLNFLDAVAAGIARALALGRVVVFGKTGDIYSLLRSFGYMRPVEYDFAESGSLAEALRKEVATGRQRLEWAATTDEQLKLQAMHVAFYTPLAAAGQLTGFFALENSPRRRYSDAEKRLLDPLAQRTAAALANFNYSGRTT